MYEADFGLNRRPFASVPRIDEYFPAVAAESARATLTRCIERAEGAGIIIGPSGSGKTLICRILAEYFKTQFAVALLAGGGLSNRRTLLQAILYELGRPYRGLDEGELRLAMLDYLTAAEDGPKAMVLLVDEAHTLPLRLLDELRMITNLVVDGQPKTRLVLAGLPLLEERLAHPKLESFSQRLAGRCYLEPLNRTETEQYIQAQMTAAGAKNSSPIFVPEACLAVYKATDGVPRLINQVCDHAMLLAYTGGRTQIGETDVQEAWADLQQLPTPWSAESQASQQQGVVEFGSLSEESEEAKPAHPNGQQPDRDETSPDRLSASDGSSESGDPVACLEEIQKTLNDLDEDFQPVGSIGPEVELVFDECVNPFAEEFEEEVVVADRYGAARGPTLNEAISPPTRSYEPEPAVEQPDPWSFPGRDPYQGREPPTNEQDAEQPAAHPVEASGPETDLQEERWEPDNVDSAAVEEDEPETVLLRRDNPDVEDEAEEPDDGEMIIVEDGYESVGAPHTRRVAAVRRQQYAQLSARLRRSS